MSLLSDKLVKRKIVCILLGIVSGVVCCALAASGSDTKVWGTPLMWAILWNRLLLGLFVFVVGVFNYHAILKIRLRPWLRGAMCGLIISIGPAIGSLMAPGGYKPEAVWGTLVMGAIYGLIIDTAATRIGGEGRALIGEWTR